MGGPAGGLNAPNDAIETSSKALPDRWGPSRVSCVVVDHATSPPTAHGTAWQPNVHGPGLPTSWRGFGTNLARRRLRVAPWQGNPYVALVGPAGAGRSPRPDEIRFCLNTLDQQGVIQAVTPALSPFEAEPFFQTGFRLFERLHLLSCTLPDLAIPGRRTGKAAGARLTPGGRWHHRAVLDVDGHAFDGFWRFDERALREAKAATPSSRFRVAKISGSVVGYAVTGRAGRRGYLQRLAVDPRFQGRGIGSMLVNDSFRWLARRRVTESLVNTQESNTDALRLYEHLGYRRQSEGLLVLRWDRST